jgi:hypothetical protein
VYVGNLAEAYRNVQQGAGTDLKRLPCSGADEGARTIDLDAARSPEAPGISFLESSTVRYLGCVSHAGPSS